MRKLRSFTLMELMISLLISGIVISISYYALLFFNKQFRRYRQASSSMNSLLLLKKALRADLERSPFILDSSTLNASTSKIAFYDSARLQVAVEYHISPEYIVRQGPSSTDSFFPGADFGRIRHVSDSLPLLCSFMLNTRMNGDTIGSLFVKDYTASELMAAEQVFAEKQR